jgi:hypothetical protein
MIKRVLFCVILLILLFGLVAWRGNIHREYNDSLPKEKLPWPHQKPGLSMSEYEKLIDNLWIINNYGLYQASEDKSVAYFHSGLDIVLANGTKLYALESGYVKAAVENKHVIIGNTAGNNPGVGWDYVHVANFQFQKGDYVNQGEYIADVMFDGLSHLHLMKVYVESGSWEYYENINCIHPDKDFFYIDSEPPIIKKPFYYFRNNTDILFKNTHPTVVHGDIDIVVALRDPGEFAHSKRDGFGDRLCVAKIEYDIYGETSQPVHRKSFDFTKIVVNNFEDLAKERVWTVFKHYTVLRQGTISGDKTFCYYIITNTDGTGEFQKIDISAGEYGWDTEALDRSGKRLFPDGLYFITVTAYDFLGNISVANDTVTVLNDEKKRGKRRR